MKLSKLYIIASVFFAISSVFSIKAGDGVYFEPKIKSGPSVSVSHKGRYSSPGWKEWIKIFQHNKRKKVIYYRETKNELQRIEYLKSLSCIKNFEDNVYIICYRINTDGLDPDAFMVVVINGNEVYENRSNIKKLNDGSLEFDQMKFDPKLPKIFFERIESCQNRARLLKVNSTR